MASYVGLPVLEQYLKFPELHVLGRYPLKRIQNATDANLVENRLIGLMPTLQQFYLSVLNLIYRAHHHQ